jgi:hypothetical protein
MWSAAIGIELNPDDLSVIEKRLKKAMCHHQLIVEGYSRPTDQRHDEVRVA